MMEESLQVFQSNIPKRMKKIIKVKMIQCELCCEEVQKYRMARICECDHQFCQYCLLQHIEQKLKDFELINCPYGNCKAKVDRSSGLIVTLTESEKNKYKKIMFRKFAEEQNWILCPNQYCEEGRLQKKGNGKNGKCSKCDEVYCLKCMKLMHKGSCEKSEERYLRKMYNYIKCKSCMRLVEKSKGCNHMTCKCGFEFCYICGQAWRGHRVCEIVESVVQESSYSEENQINYPEPSNFIQKFQLHLLKSNLFQTLNKRFALLSLQDKIKYGLLKYCLYYQVLTIVLILWLITLLLAIAFVIVIIALIVPFLSLKLGVQICRKGVLKLILDRRIYFNECNVFQILLFILFLVPILLFAVLGAIFGLPIILVRYACKIFPPFAQMISSIYKGDKIRQINIYGEFQRPYQQYNPRAERQRKQQLQIQMKRDKIQQIKVLKEFQKKKRLEEQKREAYCRKKQNMGLAKQKRTIKQNRQIQKQREKIQRNRVYLRSLFQYESPTQNSQVILTEKKKEQIVNSDSIQRNGKRRRIILSRRIDYGMENI